MTIKFCELCNNMYYMKIEGEEGNQKLQYFCKNCGDTQNHSKEESNLVLKKCYNKGEKNYKDIVNVFTREDVSLPRVNNIICPNEDCLCNKNSEELREVIYIKYDSENLRFIYLCCLCNTAWKNNSSGTENQIELIDV